MNHFDLVCSCYCVHVTYVCVCVCVCVCVHEGMYIVHTCDMKCIDDFQGADGG